MSVIHLTMLVRFPRGQSCMAREIPQDPDDPRVQLAPHRRRSGSQQSATTGNDGNRFPTRFPLRRAGISPVVIENQAAYVAGWLSKLRDDRKLLVYAAAQAQKAVDFILDGQFTGN